MVKIRRLKTVIFFKKLLISLKYLKNNQDYNRFYLRKCYKNNNLFYFINFDN